MTTNSPDTPLRVGVIGLGWAGQQHLASYAARPDVQVVGIAGLEDQLRTDLAAKYEVPNAVPRWEDLLTQVELDAVSIAVPTFLHAPIAIAALDAGIHVLSEKPMARTAAEADAMVAAARRSNRVLEVAFNHRYRGDISSMRDQVEAGALGRVYHAKAEWWRRAGIPSLGSWFTNKAMGGGGPLIDLGVHMLDATLHMLGEPRVLAVSAVTHAELGPRGLGGSGSGKQAVGSAFEVEDLGVVMLRLEGGVSFTLEASWATHRPSGDDMAITLYGTDGGVELRTIDYAPATVTVFGAAADGSDDVVLPERESLGHRAVVDRFLVAVADPSRWNVYDGTIGATRTRILEAAYLSAERGAEVRMDELMAEVAR
ncbi:Gfo/Idh/MocA family protein [Pseudactinotalea suaedae]|uniref:Gfo/Idh/MocA family protein n=1 Tax=Pseudactinotalea suaedae TaxID=1524924 RepID=UPI003450D2A6